MLTIDLRDEMPGSFALYLFGDTHVGNESSSDATIESFVRQVKGTKQGFASLGGDQFECIAVKDKRYAHDTHSTATRWGHQRDHLINLLDPLGRRLKWALDGNHEKTIANDYLINEDLRKHFNTHDAGEGFTYTIKALFPGFRLLDWHGMGSVNSKAGDAHQRERNDEIKVKRKLRDLPADDCEVNIMHHIHKMRISKPIVALNMVTDPTRCNLEQTYTEPSRIWIDKKKEIYRIPEEERWYASSGAALKTYDEGISGYGEVLGFRATEMGCIVVRVKNDKVQTVEKVRL